MVVYSRPPPVFSILGVVGTGGEPWEVLGQTPLWQGADSKLNTVGGQAGGDVDTARPADQTRVSTRILG